MSTPMSDPPRGPSGRGFGRSRILTRRQLLRSAGVGAAGVSLAAVLAACNNGGGPKDAGAFDWSAQKEAGTFTFANWPFYMDKAKVNGETVHPSIERFTKETGISVDYLEVIDDYASFFAKIRPVLAAGRSTGFDVIVTGYPRWYPLMIALDYLIPLDDSLLPHFNANVADIYKDPPYDPHHGHGLPFASGMTGIGYNPDLTGREITSIMDLFDPAFAGKVGMFGDTEDMPNFTLLGMGVEPSGRRRRTGTPLRTCCASSATRASCASTTARDTSATCSRATSPSRWRGHPTSISRTSTGIRT